MSFKDEFISRYPQLPTEGRAPAADMRQGQRARMAQKLAPLGTPPADYTVRSVYDSRPISSQDFNIPLPLLNPESDPTGSYPFTVPQGYVGILREVFVVEASGDSTKNALLTEITISLQSNGADVPYNVDIPIGLAMDRPLKCFVLADELQTLGIRIVSTTGNVNAFYAYCYGNFLLKTGRPYIFEIGNFAGKVNETQPGMANAAEGGVERGIPERASQIHGLSGDLLTRPRYVRRPR